MSERGRIRLARRPGGRRGVTTNSFFSLLGFGVPTLILVACTPTLVHQMGTTQYGLWSVSLAAFQLMGALELGFGTALSKYIAEYRSAGNIPGISATATVALTGYVCVGILLTLVMLIGAPALSRLFHPAEVPHATLVRIVETVSLAPVPLLVLSGSLAVAVGMERFEIPMAALLAQNGLTILVALAVVEAGGSVVYVVLSSLAVLSVVAIAASLVAIRMLGQVGARLRLRRGYTRPLLLYTAFTGATSAGSLLFGSVDRLVIGTVLGLEAVAYYSVSIGVANKLLAVADVASRPLLPATSRWMAAGQIQNVHLHARRATAATAVASFTIAAAALVVSGPLMGFWMGRPFATAALTPFRVLVVVYALLAVAAPAYHVANGTGRAWLPALTGTVGGIATIGLIAVLGRSYGLGGAAAANGAYLINLAIPATLFWMFRKGIPMRAEAADAAPEFG